MIRFKRLIACGFALGLFATTARAEVALPANYTQLDYIQSTGLEWIDTGYKPGYRTVTTMEAIPVDVSYKCAFFGCWMESGSGFSYGMYLNGNKNLAATFKGTGTGDWKSNQKPPTAGATYKMMLDGPNHKSYYWKNGELDDTLSHTAVASGSSTSSMLIFATRVNNGAMSIPSKIKFLSMQITEDGTPARDFVPCRNEKGEAGLWDLVEGKFYDNKGTGRFVGPDDAAMLDYLQSSRSYQSSVDTGYYAQPTTCIDLDFQLTAYNAEQRIFGMYGDNSDCMTMLLYTWSSDGNYRTRMGKYGTSDNTNSGVEQDTNRHVHTLDGWNGKYYIDGEEKTAQGKNLPDGTLPANKTLWFFFPQGGANNDYPVMKLYGSQFYEWENGVKTLKHDWVPWRDAGGGIGLCDLSTETFKAQTGNALAWRLAYMQDAENHTVLKLHDGTLAAEHLTTAYMKRFASITAVEKVTYGELAAGAVTSYSTPLTLSKGVFSLADGAVKTVSVSGALTFKGGATLKIDATSAACDMFNVSSLNLLDATSANPFVIDISNEGAGTDWLSGATLTLVTGTGLADGICGNIRVTQSGPEELAAAVKDGSLIIRLKPTPRAIWTGAAGNYDFADVGNWEYIDEYDEPQVLAPDENTDVYFRGSAVPDITGSATFAAKSLILSATLDHNCDWSALPATIPVSGTIDLKGCKLMVADLPATWTAEITDSNGYELLDYIQSNSKGEYIDTGVIGKSGIQMILDAKIVSSSSSACIVGERSAYPTTTGCAFWYNGSTKYPAIGYGAIDSGYTASSLTVPLNTRCVWSNDNARLYVDGVLAIDKSDTQASFNSNLSITLFLLHKTGGMDTGMTRPNTTQVYSLRILDSGVVVRDFVPARRVSDGVVGLLDLAAQKAGTGKEFYPNDGTGALTAGAVTGAVGGGELHVSVASGKTVENTSVTLSGTLKLVKEGEGTLVSMDATQTYVGGTDVLGGTAKLGGNSYLGFAYAPITVYEGAVLDIGAGLNRKRMRPVLAGGTLVNPDTECGNTAEQNSVIVLTDDSFINFTKNGGMIGVNYTATTLDLGGKTLDVTVASGKSFWLDNAAVSAGLFKFSGGGTLAIAATSLRAAAADFDIASKVTVAVPAEVHDWTVRAGATVSGAGTITVNGTFRPMVDTAAKYTLKDGATLNLDGRSTVLDAANVTFADNATITIDLGERKTSRQVVSWTTPPAGLAAGTLKFCVPPGKDYLVKADEHGITVIRGMILILR